MLLYGHSGHHLVYYIELQSKLFFPYLEQTTEQ